MIQIMVVDDAAVIREGLKQIISRQPDNFAVCCEAHNGLDAIGKIEQYHPDVVITDVKMPKMDGFALIAYLSEHFPDIKHIILSGYNDFELIRQGLRSGVEDYLLKPVDSDELIALLNKLSHAIMEERKSRMKSLEAEKLLSNSVNIAVEQFYNRLLQRGLLPAAEIDAFIAKYDIQFPRELYVVLAISNDRMEHSRYLQPLKDDPDLLDFAIQNLGQELIENRRRQCLLFHTPAHEVVVIVGYPAASTAEDIKSESIAIAEEIRSTIENYLEHTVTIGVSGAGSGAESLWKWYADAHAAAKYRMFYGNNRVIHIDECRSAGSEAIVYPVEYEKKLINYLSLCDQKNAALALDKIFTAISAYEDITPAQVYQVLKDVLTRISLCLKEMDHTLAMQLEETIAKDDAWKSYDNIPQLKQWLLGVVSVAIQMLSDRNSGSKSVIYEAKKYVANNYFHNISLNVIADLLNISPQYFSELFKKETGENFVKYLTNVRIEKAKELMATPGIKTYEIAELVGYDNSTYFNKVFKKTVGISPQKYRDTHFKKK